uniref:Uncharacterized protein n=1 Tax=Erwinia phage Fifi051 TaxID=3238787 RepID=A0AB39ACL1_9CAUD
MKKESSLYHSIQDLMAAMFEAERRRLQANIDRLVDQHREITGSSPTGFMYNGVLFRHSKTKTIERLPMLAWSLNDEMNRHLKDEAQIMLDCQQISQIIFKLLSRATCDQEARDLLPDCVVSLIPKFSQLRRSRSVEEAIEDDPRLVRQYQKMLPKIQIYVVSRLMY